MSSIAETELPSHTPPAKLLNVSLEKTDVTIPRMSTGHLRGFPNLWFSSQQSQLSGTCFHTVGTSVSYLPSALPSLLVGSYWSSWVEPQAALLSGEGLRLDNPMLWWPQSRRIVSVLPDRQLLSPRELLPFGGEMHLGYLAVPSPHKSCLMRTCLCGWSKCTSGKFGGHLVAYEHIIEIVLGRHKQVHW